MRLSSLLLTLFRFFLPPALICTLLLYFNAPLLDCTFPLARKPEAGCSIPGQQKAAIPGENAPFRLLAFADPQLEGDSSVQSVDWRILGWKWRKEGIGGLIEGVREGGVGVLKAWRKRIDLWGNDLYLAHTYRGVSWWSRPTHMVVLGDLLGSQWVSDEEFRRRSERFWKKVFRGAETVPASITGRSGRVEVLGQDERWKNRIIAVAGNHDIGYAGDIDAHRIERFENAFGAVNWDVTFRLSNSSDTPMQSNLFGSGISSALSNDPELHLVILNSMNLDGPAKDSHLQEASRDHALNTLSRDDGHFSSAAQRRRAATVLLTHIPFDKPSGTCADDTFFDWFPPSSAPDGGGGIKEQNHLSKETSHFLLDSIASGSGKAIILNGHDHEGCQTYHYIGHTPSAHEEWETVRLADVDSEVLTQDYVGMREITVRSMMGEFGGYVGFLSGWFDWEEGRWKFEYNSCPLGVQHFWWGVHVFDLIVIALGVGGVVLMILEEMAEAKEEERRQIATKKTL